MLSTIIETERHLNSLLPQSRKEQNPTAALLASAEIWSQSVWNMAEGLGAMPLSEEQVKEGYKLAQKPVFICGVHRSGTTLVRDLLDGHPDLLVLPSEGTYYTRLESKLHALPEDKQPAFLGQEWLRRLANPINQPPYWMLGRSSESGSPYVNFARHIMAWWKLLDHKNDAPWPHLVVILALASCSENPSARLWVDKTPTNERYLQRIWKEMPGAKFVHVIRDPVATMVSRKKLQPSFSMRTALNELKLSFRVALEQSALNDPRYLIVRYEELCETPGIMIQKLASFLNIEINDLLYHPTVAGIPAQANSSFNREAAAGEILKAGQHQQQDVLGKAGNQLVAAYVGALSRRLGYPVNPVGSLQGFYLKAKHGLF